MIESELIAGVRAGHPGAFAALVGAYQAGVYNLCYRMLGDAREAEDAAQETFLRVYSQFHRYDSTRPFKTWLFAIASHYCVDRLRKRRVKWLSLDDELFAEGEMWRSTMPDPEEVALGHERRDEVTALLALLAPHDRSVIVLRYWSGLSYAEIADVLGATVSSVKSRLHRARVALGRRMTAEVGQHEGRGEVLPGDAKRAVPDGLAWGAIA
jgi:RNA polymerase sigma-70 factor (ECF subfamily)